jgi:hypothetical protein
MKTRVTFWLSFLLSSSICLAALSRLTPKHHYRVPDDIAAQTPGPFLAVYQDIGLDYYVFRFGLLGSGKAIREADLICTSSSKGLHGYDPEILSAALSTPDRPVRVFNLSFGFGEGLGYPTEVIKTLDLHDKVLLADLTDNTCQWHFTGMAQQALQAQNAFDAYKVLCERWLTFGRAQFLAPLLPRIAFRPASGFVAESTMTGGIAFRSSQHGGFSHAFRKEVYYPEAGKYPFEFDRDGQIHAKFLDECARRNIQIVFTSIPYRGYDPEWGNRVAAELGYRHVTVDPSDIELIDDTHMSTNGRRLFSTRLGRRLQETGDFEAALDSVRKIAPIAAGTTGTQLR